MQCLLIFTVPHEFVWQSALFVVIATGLIAVVTEGEGCRKKPWD
jgi:hypothetical protein